MNQRLVLLVLLLLASLSAAIHMRSLRDRAHCWHRHQRREVRAWMNLSYISRCYHVPEARLQKALQLPQRDRRPLWKIAHDRKVPIHDVLRCVRAAIDEIPETGEKEEAK